METNRGSTDTLEAPQVRADALNAQVRRLRYAVWALATAFVVMAAAWGASLLGAPAGGARLTAGRGGTAGGASPGMGWPLAAEVDFLSPLQSLAHAQTPWERFEHLGPVAKDLVDQGELELARAYAQELAEIAPYYQEFGNEDAIEDLNVVFGRIAVRDGDIDAAKRHLRLAGKAPGSPTRSSFGPNMSLAKDLLEEGEIAAVVRFFEDCRQFWEMDRGRLTEWTRIARAGGIPDFGANLVY